MKRLSLFLLVSMAMALPITAMETQPTKSRVALTYAAKGAQALGYGLWTIASKTFGWTFGLGQMAVGGAALGAGVFGAYSLFKTHQKTQNQNISNDELIQTLAILGGTAVAVPLGLIFVSGGCKNIWNA
ncbi:hypothetical protein BH09DEP1_BH09DEP1_6900 [soil metagenome]